MYTRLLNNKLHILTILLFGGLMIAVRHHPDALMWVLLFLLIVTNALLFIAGKAIPFLSWLVMVIGILGMFMSLPHLWDWGYTYIRESTTPGLSDNSVVSTIYFSVSILFSSLQVYRLLP